MTVSDIGLGFADTDSLVSAKPETLIPREEFLQRQDAVRHKAAEASLDGLVVYSRGGSAVDMHPEVFYLTNHYSPHPYFAVTRNSDQPVPMPYWFFPSMGRPYLSSTDRGGDQILSLLMTYDRR